MELGQILGLLAALCGALLLIVYRNQEARIKEQAKAITSQETRVAAVEHAMQSDAEKAREHIRKELHEFRTETRGQFQEMKSETATKREEARHELHVFRSEIGGRVETVRTETNSRLDAATNKIDGLVNQIQALAILSVQERERDRPQRTI